MIKTSPTYERKRQNSGRSGLPRNLLTGTKFLLSWRGKALKIQATFITFPGIVAPFLPPYLHTSVRQLSGQILENRSSVAPPPLECTVAHRCRFLKRRPCRQVKRNVLHYHYTQHHFSRNTGGTQKYSVYCNAVCLLSSRLIPDLVIVNCTLLAHSVVDLHPGVMETKQEQQNVMIWRMSY